MRPPRVWFEFIMSFLACIQYIMQTVRVLWAGERGDEGKVVITQKEKKNGGAAQEYSKIETQEEYRMIQGRQER